jgi:hypothetical protein
MHCPFDHTTSKYKGHPLAMKCEVPIDPIAQQLLVPGMDLNMMGNAIISFQTQDGFQNPSSSMVASIG